ncbi:MAG TPA: HAMP domain-containing sensor histidine kinase [Chryseosolibacter sp.]
MSTSQKRNDIVAKNVAVIFGSLSFIVLGVLVILFGPNINTPVIAGLGIFFFLVRFSISRGYSTTGKLLLCLIPPVVTFVAALLPKLYSASFTDILYYDSRFVLVLLSSLPCLVFDLKERAALWSTLSISLLLIILFDPVHNWLSIGYYQKGFTGRSYYYINYITVVTFLGIVGGAFTLKQSVFVSEEKYRLTFQRLALAFKNLRVQNEKIKSQQAELVRANTLIEQQKAALEDRVHQINVNLQNANDELIRHNNELTQFSYAVSHNLRGPIARLLGLSNLLTVQKLAEIEADGPIIIKHIHQSAKDLDEIIKDLGQIVDIRNNVLQRKEVIHWEAEWAKIRGLLNLSDNFVNDHIRIDFTKAPAVHGVRMMVSSILYNLVSNAIKYQSPERELEIAIRTSMEDNVNVLEITDNGLGINLASFGVDVFKMYKRFHTHQDGKGIGLYLVKTQVEALSGKIEIESALNVGTTFRVKFPNGMPEC